MSKEAASSSHHGYVDAGGGRTPVEDLYDEPRQHGDGCPHGEGTETEQCGAVRGGALRLGRVDAQLECSVHLQHGVDGVLRVAHVALHQICHLLAHPVLRGCVRAVSRTLAP
jgi:hypothetical protein